MALARVCVHALVIKLATVSRTLPHASPRTSGCPGLPSPLPQSPEVAGPAGRPMLTAGDMALARVCVHALVPLSQMFFQLLVEHGVEAQPPWEPC